MEGISELKELFMDKYEKKVPYTEKYLRKVSVYLTWILLHTDLSANQATFIMIFLGILSGVFFCFGDRLMTLIGAVLLFVWYFFDLIDGEIAAYRKTCSTTGSYLDSVSHYIVHPFIFFCLGYGLYRELDTHIALFLGYMACLGYILLEIMSDLKYKYKYLAKLHEKTLMDRSINSNIQMEGEGVWIKIIKMYCLFPGVMNLIIITAVIDILMGDIVIFNTKLTIIGLLLTSYGIFYPLSCVVTLCKIVRNKNVGSLVP